MSLLVTQSDSFHSFLLHVSSEKGKLFIQYYSGSSNSIMPHTVNTIIRQIENICNMHFERMRQVPITLNNFFSFISIDRALIELIELLVVNSIGAAHVLSFSSYRLSYREINAK